MAGQPRRLSGLDSQPPATDRPLYLFGEHGPRTVCCRTRWMTDKYAYVVAPLATATLVRQRWQATTSAPNRDREPVVNRRGQFDVELVSAEALWGSDSGKEGLLLRFLAPKAPPATERDAPARAIQGWNSPHPQATAGA